MPVGARQAGLVRMPPPPPLVFIVILISMVMIMSTQADPDADALLKFKETLEDSSGLGSWNPSTKPCNGNTANWIGVLCYGDTVWGLRLEGMGLKGNLNFDSLASMRYLRTISLMNNYFSGPMPEIKKLSGLKSLYLSNNQLSGEIPDDAFEGMGSLKKVLIANNAFGGRIPSSLASLPRLLELRLNGNKFQGWIPDFKQSDLKLASFENNELEGSIPESLSKLDPGSFAGNTNLCGPPLGPCNGKSSPFEDSFSSLGQNLSLYSIAIILIVIGIILAIISIAAFIFQWKKRQSTSDSISLGHPRTSKLLETYEHPEPHMIPVVSRNIRRATNQGKLIFVHNNVEMFDLQDLLRASAEVLGSGTFGASYKTTIRSGQTLVVKRYKQMNNVRREEFHEHMMRLGRLRHPNVLPLLAYYYRREEKLLVTEFVQNNCLASHLHANRSADQPALDWPTRLKIIKGIARGLSYLFAELPTLTIPHGHLKSTNVLLDESLEPVLTDYALRPVMNSEHAHTLMTAYKSPEYTNKKCITKKTDIWCLGVLILELLTGKFPENYLKQMYDGNCSLATWVSEMVREKKMNEVFDKEMMGKKISKGEMIKLLKIGLSCCEEDEERRMEIKEALEKIEQLREGDSDCSASEGNSYSFRVIEDDFAMNR